MQVCVDTSILIDWLRQSDGSQTIFERLISGQHLPVVSTVVVAELYSGRSVWQHKQAKARLDGVLAECRVIPLEPAMAILAGSIHNMHKTPLLDALIAATAITQSLPLATLNTKDFSAITDITLWSAGD
ncbi:type II toxin-antitoxin system VapC family toxin [Candidatus Woesebacteria bacterium]|nr:type II toxin-antitoxin system VapC family toxin [Candidatus Woesebacteria bacterium]